MVKRVTLHLLAIALMVGVSAMTLHAVAHWHTNTYDEQHCQICQVAHTATPQPAVQAVAPPPVPVARFVPEEEPTLEARVVANLGIPRAPPA